MIIKINLAYFANKTYSMLQYVSVDGVNYTIEELLKCGNRWRFKYFFLKNFEN